MEHDDPTLRTVPERDGGDQRTEAQGPSSASSPGARRQWTEDQNPEPSGEAKEDAPLSRGAAVGRYLVLHPLGQGGMGIVYAAYDSELDRKVAVKVLKASTRGASASGGQTRLLREAQAMARISHPNVISIYDVGTLGDRVFLAMEFVDGGTLKKWLREKQRSWQEILRAFAEAGRGLAAAHAAGLVHRDFKPENVLVGKDGRVFVTDFGLARLVADGAADPTAPDVGDNRNSEEISRRLSSPLTQAGTVMGTPHYMAPEQHLGAKADARTDQFAFCAALYWALYRKRPFDPQRLAAAAAESETSGATEPVRASSARRFFRDVIQEPPRDAKVPGWLKKVVLRGLSLDAEGRHPSMEELLRELGRDPAVARRRWGIAAAAALAVLGGGVAYQRAAATRTQLCTGASKRLAGVWDPAVKKRLGEVFSKEGGAAQADRVASLLDGYTESWVSMHTDACQATRLRGEQTEAVLSLRMMCLDKRLNEVGALTRLLAHADAKLVDQSVDAVHGLASIRQCADVEALSAPVPLPEDPNARAEIKRIEGALAEVKALRSAGQYKLGLEKAQAAVSDAVPLHFRPLEAEALFLKGVLEDRIGESETGVRTLVDAVYAADAGKDDALKVQALARLVYVVGYRLGRGDDARSWGRMGQAALERQGQNPELEAELQNNLGTVYYRESRFAEALPAYERALALDEATVGRNDPKRANVLGNLGYIHARLGDRPRAIRELQEAVTLMEQLRGPDHPVLMAPLVSLANVSTELRDWGAAHRYADRAVAISTKRYGPEHPSTADVIDIQATVFQEEGQYAKAMELFQKTLAMKKAALGPANSVLSFSLDGIGQCLVAMGRERDAIRYLEEALKIGDSPSLLADSRFALAKALAATRQDRARAQALANQALAGYVSAGFPEKAQAVERWLAAREGK